MRSFPALRQAQTSFRTTEQLERCCRTAMLGPPQTRGWSGPNGQALCGRIAPPPEATSVVFEGANGRGRPCCRAPVPGWDCQWPVSLVLETRRLMDYVVLRDPLHRGFICRPSTWMRFCNGCDSAYTVPCAGSVPGAQSAKQRRETASTGSPRCGAGTNLISTCLCFTPFCSQPRGVPGSTTK